MAEDNSEKDKVEGDVGQIPQTPVIIHTQYLKDMSFENPNAPDILKKGKKPPEMDMNLSMDVRKLENEEIENLYEVILNVNAKALREGKAMFIAEIVYGAAVSITGLEEKQHHPLLLTEVPYMLFPFVRQILSNATQAGGFIPLQITPVDFRSMYIKRFSDQSENKESSEKSA